MATSQTNGSTTTATSTKNNGGATIAGSNSKNIKSSPFVQQQEGVFGSTIVNGFNTTKANSLGVFKYNNARSVAMKTTSNLAAINNSFLISGANDPESLKSINYMVIDRPTGLGSPGSAYVDGTRTTLVSSAFRDGKLDIMTGKFFSGYPGVSNDYFFGIDNSSGDKAVKINRLVPGSLVYKLSQKSISKNYSKITG